MAVVVGRRRFHAFLSHAHVDKNQADHLFRLLHGIAGIPVWYDAIDLPPGATIAENLFQAIENSRAATILLSEQSITRGWVKLEYQAAINHQQQHQDFRIVPIRLDDVEPPNFLQNYSNVRISDGLDAAATAHILKGLYRPANNAVDPSHDRNTYVGRGWQPGDADVADAVCEVLSSAGLRLVGDAEDQPSWVEERVAKIIDSCGAFAAILPFRPSMTTDAPHTTSKYVLKEWQLAADRGLPCLVVLHPRARLPQEAMMLPGLITLDDDVHPLLEQALILAEQWQTPRRGPFVFYATDFATEGRALRAAVKEVIEATTALPCRIGEYIEGQAVQREILCTVTNASLVLADITGESPNVYIEIGAARAADVPVALLRAGPSGRPPFMLRDQQAWDFATDAELVARVLRITYPYRRSLLTPHRS